MWLIPGKTKVKTEIFKGVGFVDILVAAIGVGIITLLLLSNVPYKYMISIGLATFIVFLLLKIDEEANYLFIFHMLKHMTAKKHYIRSSVEVLATADKNAKNTVKRVSAFTDIKDDLIIYDTSYYGAVIEIPPVEFRFFTESRKNNTIINGIGKVLRNISPDYYANIVKIDRPIDYENYIDLEYDKLDRLKEAFENGDIREDELKSRVEIIYDRIKELQYFNEENRVHVPYYYLCLFEGDKHQLEGQLREVIDSLHQAELEGRRLGTKELAVFLKYTNYTNVNEEEIEELEPEQYAVWAMPEKIDIKMRTMEVDNTVASVKRIVTYPSVVSDAWLAYVMSMPGTKVVIKCKQMDREKSVRAIDRSLNELRSRAANTSVDSKLMELESHIQTLSELLETLHGENETLMQMNIYITAYDLVATEKWHKEIAGTRNDLPRINNLGKTIRRIYRENNLRLNNLDFQQLDGYIGSQVSSYDPFSGDSRGIPSNTISAAYPWVYANIADERGIKLGANDGVPVFLDFFRRDNERVNSNMVIVGKSGSGKSYATKSLLTNLAADDSKIFILDPENEYTELANNLHGKFINVGNAQYGRMNPFNIITALDDDESDGETVSGSYATHLQFLEEFFRQILPDCEKDALEYLNSIIDRMYMDKGITAETDLSKLKPVDFPVFDDLYDSILKEFQETDNQYIRTMLRTLMNYIQKFATGGRNANIWNGPSTITTEEKFTVFNFQSLLANRNNTIANAQMLLVLKYIDNEIIKNRDYNLKNNAMRKIIVVVDEAHVFIDEKFPVALDFMYQLAKRIRKYNGMQIVITQNIKDFVGTEEIARKSTAIINACQYSFIFSLAPNDMDDLCKLYEKAGGINEKEQEQIVSAQRGQVFTVLGPDSRSAFKVEVPENVVSMFESREFTSRYFEGEGGDENWANYLGDSRDKREATVSDVDMESYEEEQEKLRSEFVSLEIFSGEYEDKTEKVQASPVKSAQQKTLEVKAQEMEVKTEMTGIDYSALAAAMASNARETSRTEEKLTALVEKLSAQNLELMINERVENEVRERVQEAMSKIRHQEERYENYDNDDDDDDDDDDDSFNFDDDDDDDDIELDDPVKEEPSLSTGSSLGSIFGSESSAATSIFDDDDDDDGSDFMKMFTESVNMMDKVSAIEMMEVYEETVTEITLEDLDKYILNVIVNGGNQSEA